MVPRALIIFHYLLLHYLVLSEKLGEKTGPMDYRRFSPFSVVIQTLQWIIIIFPINIAMDVIIFPINIPRPIVVG